MIVHLSIAPSGVSIVNVSSQDTSKEKIHAKRISVNKCLIVYFFKIKAHFDNSPQCWLLLV